MIKKIVFATLLCDMVFAGVGFAACNEDFAKMNAAVKKMLCRKKIWLLQDVSKTHAIHSVSS